MRVVVALGGNALLTRGEPMTAEAQRRNVQRAARALAPLARQHQLLISHGNGPQVGLLALQAAAYSEVDTYPLDLLDAQTEGMIGYLIEQELRNLLPVETLIATLLTMVEVDPHDSMGPKVMAACWFVRQTGQRAVIGALADLDKMVAGTAGTQVSAPGG